MWYINICFPNGETRDFDLSRGEVVIGRAPDCGLVLDDLGISRYHAKISIGNIGVIIEDMQSSNGVIVNGHVVVDRVVLRAGDEILLGNIKLNLLAGEDEERTILFQPQPEEPAEEPSVTVENLSQRPAASAFKLPTESTDVVEAPNPATVKEALAGEGLPRELQESTRITTLAEATGAAGNDAAEEFTPKLLIFVEGEPQKKYPLHREHVNIGRAEDNDIIIDHGSISRFHAKLISSGGIFTLIDLDSANGTMVNGVPISKITLKNWDEIYFGSVRAKFAGKPNPVSDPPSSKGEKSREKQQTPRHLIFLVLILSLLVILLLYIWLGK